MGCALLSQIKNKKIVISTILNFLKVKKKKKIKAEVKNILSSLP